MALSIGIVGLPNVGKSTLFTALTRRQVDAANYPFATIEPNVGIVPVPDARLDRLAELVKPRRVVPATVEFVDIAGLVKGASVGEGLGNQFLANIRETDAIAEVVRFFGDPNVVHVDGRVDPESDVETIKTELVLADLGTLERALPRLEKDAKRDSRLGKSVDIARRLYAWMERGHRARTMEMTEEEGRLVRDWHLLTMKPMLYVANVDEREIGAALPDIDGMAPVPICAKIESEMAVLEPGELAEYLEMEGLAEPGLNALIREAYRLLGLQSFFTAGEQEVRAWTVRAGARAPEAAGVIHTDFERGFIKAEVISFSDYDELGSESAVKAAGRLRVEGKEYVMADGDVVHFRFNV
ncbi:MAG: redox-regulated ATPase YchF [Coriobacteriia bacterium]